MSKKLEFEAYADNAMFCWNVVAITAPRVEITEYIKQRNTKSKYSKYDCIYCLDLMLSVGKRISEEC